MLQSSTIHSNVDFLIFFPWKAIDPCHRYHHPQLLCLAAPRGHRCPKRLRGGDQVVEGRSPRSIGSCLSWTFPCWFHQDASFFVRWNFVDFNIGWFGDWISEKLLFDSPKWWFQEFGCENGGSKTICSSLVTMNQAGTCSGDVASAQRWLENPPIVDDSSIRTVIHISIFFQLGGMSSIH